MPLLGQHHRDPHDSELEGAERIAPKVETLQERVKKLFLTFGAMTDEELLEAYVANYEPIYKNSLEPRRYELVRDGWLEKSAERRPGKSGVKRIVWAPAGPKGQRELWA